MGILRRHFWGRIQRDNDATRPDATSTTDAVSDLLMEHGLTALDKQLHLEDLVGEASWLLDQDAGTITFGGERTCAAQVLGTQSDVTGTWQWAWANPSVPERVTRDAVLMRAFGEKHGIEEFTRAQIPVSPTVSGHTLALVACQLVDADAFYPGPYEGGSVFVMVRWPDDAPRQANGDLLRALRTLSGSIMGLPVPLRREAVEAYLHWVGLATEARGRDLLGNDAAGESLTVGFDHLGRVSSLSSTLT